MFLAALLNRLLCWFWAILAKLGIQSDEEKLQRIESHLLSLCKRYKQEKCVVVEENLGIHTVVFNAGVPNRPPLVLLHGLHSGLCFWLHNIKELSQNGTVYAIDLPGFARSSKPAGLNSSDEIEMNFVRWLEQWRQNLGIEKFFLLGHEFGGYIATLYTLAHPWRVSYLILYEPWGFPILPFGITDRSPSKNDAKTSTDMFPKWFSKLDKLFQLTRHISFLSNIIWFYCLPIKWLSQITSQSLRGFYKQDIFDEYQNLCKKVERWSGKAAYERLSVLNVWARDPLIKRISNLDKNVRVTFILGSKSWFDHRTAYEVKCSRSDKQDLINVHIIDGKGTKLIHLEKSKEFEKIILSILAPFEDEDDEGWMEDDWITYDQLSS